VIEVVADEFVLKEPGVGSLGFLVCCGGVPTERVLPAVRGVVVVKDRAAASEVVAVPITAASLRSFVI